MKLNYGCGDAPKEGFVNIDSADEPGVDIVMDLEREAVPWDDGSIERIEANHFLEHVADPRLMLNEAWRVLAPGGVFYSKSPFAYYEGYPKPVHRQLIAESWFDFLRKPSCMHYGYRQWNVLRLERVNNGAEVVCEMTPFK